MQPNHSEFKSTIFKFLRDNLSLAPVATKPALIYQFIDFLEKGGLKEWQCAGCLAIDLNHNLADSKEYAQLIEAFVQSSQQLSLTQFYQFIISYTPEENVFSRKTLTNKNEEYVRVITKDAFLDFCGTETANVTRNNEEAFLEIDEGKITKHGWSGRKSIVWLTLYKEFSALLLISRRNGRPADRICDWLGFPRDSTTLKQGSPLHGGVVSYVYIKYPKGFNEVCYQPITTNANWEVVSPLFVSAPYQDDGWGRTFNCRNLSEAAKEAIHKKSVYLDEKFTAGEVGTPTAAPVDTSQLLSELLGRFSYSKP
jgi:hypothetical protein